MQPTRDSNNIVACLNLLNMRYDAHDKVAVYAQSMRRLLSLEQRPDKQVKYIDFIDIYGDLSAQEQQQYQRDYPEEEHAMMGRLAQALAGRAAGRPPGRCISRHPARCSQHITHTITDEIRIRSE